MTRNGTAGIGMTGVAANCKAVTDARCGESMEARAAGVETSAATVKAAATTAAVAAASAASAR